MSFLKSILPLLLLLILTRTSAAAGTPTVVVLGDSLTAGYGLSRQEAFPAQLEAALQAVGMSVKVINAGVSGDTSAGGLARLAWSLADDPQLVIVELGANDALRGLDPGQTRSNLDAILRELQKRSIAVLLAGMRAPRSLGGEYYTRFDPIYPELAEAYGVALYPFFLEGVAAEPRLNQQDGIHPNRAGVAEIVRRMLPQVIELLREVREPR